jgi:two-component system, chemotaxis family, chemotaxis protein CheY
MDKTLKILFVEDSDVQNELGQYRFESLGFSNFIGVFNGLDAIAYLEENQVDLIISDWDMPKMDGIDLLRVVRETPSFQKIPFIIMTVHDDHDKIAIAKKEGVTEYLCKPVSNETLLETIEKVFS